MVMKVRFAPHIPKVILNRHWRTVSNWARGGLVYKYMIILPDGSGAVLTRMQDREDRVSVALENPLRHQKWHSAKYTLWELERMYDICPQ